MAKLGRPKKRGRPKGSTTAKEDSANRIFEVLEGQILTLKDSLKSKDQALEIFTKFEGMIFALHDKVKVLEDRLNREKS